VRAVQAVGNDELVKGGEHQRSTMEIHQSAAYSCVG
jgi:hypothetical protein